MSHIELRGKPTLSVVAKDNEVLWDLCRTHAGRHDYDFVLAVQRLNEMTDPNRIETGETILMPAPVAPVSNTSSFNAETHALMWGAALNFMYSNGASDDICSNGFDSESKSVTGRVQRARVFLERHPLYEDRAGEFEYALEFVHHQNGFRQFYFAALVPDRRDRYMNYTLNWKSRVPPPDLVPESLRRHLRAFVTDGQWSPLYQPLTRLIDE